MTVLEITTYYLRFGTIYNYLTSDLNNANKISNILI